MITFIQTLAILITAAYFFGCPPRHEEPVPGSLVVSSHSKHLVIGNSSGAIGSVSYSNNYLMEKPQYGFPSLRHTFASWLVQDGISMYEVQRLFGHSSITVTEIYSHSQPCQLHNTVNRLKSFAGEKLRFVYLICKKSRQRMQNI